jgi:hypothetical protein
VIKLCGRIVEERRFSAALLVQLGRGFSPCGSKHFKRFSDPQPNGEFHLGPQLTLVPARSNLMQATHRPKRRAIAARPA